MKNEIALCEDFLYTPAFTRDEKLLAYFITTYKMEFQRLCFFHLNLLQDRKYHKHEVECTLKIVISICKKIFIAYLVWSVVGSRHLGFFKPYDFFLIWFFFSSGLNHMILTRWKNNRIRQKSWFKKKQMSGTD